MSKTQYDFCCHLCGCHEYRVRKGHARDNTSLVPLECIQCGLVTLSSFAHIDDSFYENAKMHEDAPVSVEYQTVQADEDTLRRAKQFEGYVCGKRVLDIGCGNAQYLHTIRAKARTVAGVEPERRLEPHFVRMGITVYPNLEAIPSEQYFDVASMFHVLEHTKDPLRMLQDVRGVLERERERERERETASNCSLWRCLPQAMPC